MMKSECSLWYIACLPLRTVLSKTIMLLEAIDLPIVLISAVQFQSIKNLQQQQHSIFSQASWGRLEMKPERNKFKVQAH